MTDRSIAEDVARILAARGAPPLRRPLTPAEWDVIEGEALRDPKAAVDVELSRLEELLQDDGFYRSGFTKGLYPDVDPFEGCEREAAS